jgi:opacity protein-like surface antigen
LVLPTLPGPAAVQAGWVVGGGFEHLFTSNWTVRAEALYVDLGNQTVFPTPAAAAARGAGNYSSFQTQFYNTQVIDCVGLNFKF